MKTSKEIFRIGVMTDAVRSALVILMVMPLVGMAEDEVNPEVEVLKRPINYVEIGAMNLNNQSAKFGEYSDIRRAGAYGIGNLDLRGGDGYLGGDGTLRWQVKGVDLGTDARSMGVSVSDQGRWSLGVGYDELRHQMTDTYETPYQGSMGGNNFYLPPQFGNVNTSATCSPETINGVALTGTRCINPNNSNANVKKQLSYFHPEDVYSERENKSFNAGYTFDPQWNVQFEFNRDDQSGAKLIGAGTDLVSLPTTNKFLVGGVQTSSTTSKAEAVVILMNPTNFQTDTVNLALNWTGDKGRLATSYFGSFFRDANSSLNFSNPFTGNTNIGSGSTGNALANGQFPVDQLSTVPSNELHQVNLVGGYDFSKSIKMAGGLSYGRNTQNSGYVNSGMMVTGTTYPGSLNGLVETYNANLHLTDKFTDKLTFSGGFKYNERNNESPSNLYIWNTINTNSESAYNTPYSNKREQVDLSMTYTINNQNSLLLNYGFDKIDRWCNGVAVGNCIFAKADTENSLGFNYIFKPTDSLKLNVGYSYADRFADMNKTFYNASNSALEAATNVIPTTHGAGANPQYDAVGFIPYFDASRTENKVKAGINWQATDKLELSVAGNYLHDNYGSALGVQNGATWGLSFDATFNFTENTILTAYASVQKRWRDMISSTSVTSNAVLFQNKLTDENDSVGMNLRQKGLLGGKVELAGDLSYVFGQSGYYTSPYLNGSNSSSCSTAASLVCGNTPDITDKMLRLKLNAKYQLDKSSTIGLGYMYQRLISNDFYYNAFLMGDTATSMMPTNQQNPSYSASLISATYTYNFK